MTRTSALLCVILLLAGLATCAKPRPPGPEDTLELGKSYIQKGQFDKVWGLYSVEFREQIARETEAQKETVRKELAKGSKWIQAWIWEQLHVTPEQYLRLSPREIESRRNEVARDRIGDLRAVDVKIDGETAVALVEREKGAPLSRMTFVLRDGRWLIRSSSFQPVR